MKKSFLNKFSRSPGNAPIGWPFVDASEITSSAIEMREITNELIKSLLIYAPPNQSQMKTFNKNEKLKDCVSPLMKTALRNDNKLSTSTNELSKKISIKKEKCINTNDTKFNNNSSSTTFTKLSEDKNNFKINNSTMNSSPYNIINKNEYSDLIQNLQTIPESVIAKTCLESSERMTNLQPTLSHIFFGCGQAVSQLASARYEWGSSIHKSVIQPLRNISDAIQPNADVFKCRRQAWRLGGELKSMNERVAKLESQNATKNSDIQPDYCPPLFSNNNANNNSSSPLLRTNRSMTPDFSACISSRSNSISIDNGVPKHQNQKSFINTAKSTQLNAIKIDLEIESEFMKEKALRELYNFESMSTLDCAKAMVELVEASAKYHRDCANILEETVLKLKKELNDHCLLPVFGRPLETHLKVTESQIAYPLRLCIAALNQPHILVEEGIFRSPGSKKKVDTLKSALNTMRAETIISQYDPYVVADTLKQYLRSLPEPLLMRSLFTEWSKITQMTGKNNKVSHLKKTASQMNPISRKNAAFLFYFLNHVASLSEKNRMTATNLSIIFVPTLLSPNEEISSQNNMTPDEAGVCFSNIHSLKEIDQDLLTDVLEIDNKIKIPPQFALSSEYGEVIELLITFAHEIFPNDNEYTIPETTIVHQKKDFEKNVFNPSISERSFEETPVSSKNRKCIEMSKNTMSPKNKKFDIGRKAQRCIQELSFQGRALQNFPDRFKSSHTKTASNWQSLFSRPLSTRGSRTPIQIHRTRKFRISLPNGHNLDSFISSPVLKHATSVENVPSEKQLKVISMPTRSITLNSDYELENSNDSRANSIEDCSSNQYTFPCFEESGSVESHLELVDLVETKQEEPTPELSANSPSLRSELQRQHQEWRHAMVNNNESQCLTPDKFFHRELYDTLFTLQTLNSVTGLDNFLSKIRSVYENRTSMKPVQYKEPIHACTASNVVNINGSHNPLATSVSSLDLGDSITAEKSSSILRQSCKKSSTSSSNLVLFQKTIPKSLLLMKRQTLPKTLDRCLLPSGRKLSSTDYYLFD